MTQLLVDGVEVTPFARFRHSPRSEAWQQAPPEKN